MNEVTCLLPHVGQWPEALEGACGLLKPLCAALLLHRNQMLRHRWEKYLVWVRVPWLVNRSIRRKYPIGALDCGWKYSRLGMSSVVKGENDDHERISVTGRLAVTSQTEARDATAIETPTPRSYLLYLNFEVERKIRTAEFVLKAPGISKSPADEPYCPSKHTGSTSHPGH